MPKNDLPLTATKISSDGFTAGTIAGSFAVNADGQATYSMALDVPPARANMGPALSINYNSSGGDGPLGLDFSLSGLSEIARCPPTLARDNVIRDVRYGADAFYFHNQLNPNDVPIPIKTKVDDAFCLNGRRLVQVGASGGGQTQFRTFPDSFAKVIAYSPAGWDSSKGPLYWKEWTKSGLVLYFGSPNSEVTNASTSGVAFAKNGAIRSWSVMRALDRASNTIEYSYLKQSNADGSTAEIVPLRIDYTGLAHAVSGGAPPGSALIQAATQQVVFDYGPRDPEDSRTLFTGGTTVQTLSRLHTIEMKSQGTTVREYHFGYMLGAASNRMILQEAEECAAASPGSGQICRPPTRFRWNNMGAASFKLAPTNVIAPISQGSTLVMDVTGDGLDDIVRGSLLSPGNIATAWDISSNLGQVNIFSTPPDHAFVEPNNVANQIQVINDPKDPETIFTPYPDSAAPIDYDQDGRMDLLLLDKSGQAFTSQEDPQGLNWKILLAQPNGKFVLKDTGIANNLIVGQVAWNIFTFTSAAHVADVTGDGVPDLITCDGTKTQFDDNGLVIGAPQATWRVFPWLGLGAFDGQTHTGFDGGHSAQIDALKDYPCSETLIPVDINADGKVDLVRLHGKPGASDINKPNHGYGLDTKFDVVGLANGGVGQDGKFILPSEWAWEMEPTSIPLYPQGADRGLLVFLDVNGDGLPDAVEGGSADRNLRTFINTGDVFLQCETTAQGICPPPAINQGFDGPFLSTLAPQILQDLYLGYATPIDFNADGRKDLLIPITVVAPGLVFPDGLAEWYVLQSTGAEGPGTFTPISLNYLYDTTSHTAPLGSRVTDANADGADDAIVLGPDGLQFAILQGTASRDVITSIIDGQNSRQVGDPFLLENVSIKYGSTIDTTITEGSFPSDEELIYRKQYDPNNSCDYPRTCVVGPRRVVSDYYINDGVDQKESLRHFGVLYRDGRTDRLFGGWLGFGERLIRDFDTLAGSAEFYDNTTYDSGLRTYTEAGGLAAEWRWNPALQGLSMDPLVVLSYTGVTLSPHGLNKDPALGVFTNYFTSATARTERRAEAALPFGSDFEQTIAVVKASATPGSATEISSTTQEFSGIDPYGNIWHEKTTTDGLDLIDTIDRTFPNPPDLGSWRIDLLLSESDCSDVISIGKQCRSSSFDYDTLGQLKHETIGKDQKDTHLEIEYGRDKYGNIVTVTADDDFGNHRVSCTGYDAEGVFPRSQTNAEGHTVYTRFDPGFGILNAAVDQNELLTQWAHDAFGRVT